MVWTTCSTATTHELILPSPRFTKRDREQRADQHELNTHKTTYFVSCPSQAKPENPDGAGQLTHPVLPGARGDLVARRDAQVRPGLFGEGLDRRPPVAEDEANRLRGDVHGGDLGFRGGGHASGDLWLSVRKWAWCEKWAALGVVATIYRKSGA